jgi:chromate transporter
MFVGYAAGGVPGAFAALLGSILPPTLIMLGVVSILQRLRGEAWVGNFTRGLAPAVAVLMVIVAWQVFQGEGKGSMGWSTLLIAGLSLVALLLKLPPPLVLLGAGILGIFLFR